MNIIKRLFGHTEPTAEAMEAAQEELDFQLEEKLKEIKRLDKQRERKELASEFLKAMLTHADYGSRTDTAMRAEQVRIAFEYADLAIKCGKETEQ